VDCKSWDQLRYLAIHLLAVELHPVVLSQVVSLPTFLEFDSGNGTYRETRVYEAILRLLNEVRRFNRANNENTLSVVFAHSKRDREPDATEVHIETYNLATLLRLLDLWVNVLDLSLSLVKYLDGAQFNRPTLLPDSPIVGMQREIDAETLTDAELNAFITRG
jgi:hypothetical protein